MCIYECEREREREEEGKENNIPTLVNNPYIYIYKHVHYLPLQQMCMMKDKLFFKIEL